MNSVTHQFIVGLQLLAVGRRGCVAVMVMTGTMVRPRSVCMQLTSISGISIYVQTK